LDVLYGDWNPSGRLPYTIAKDINHYPAQRTLDGGPENITSIPYTEGLFIDYRHFDAVSRFLKCLETDTESFTAKHYTSI